MPLFLLLLIATLAGLAAAALTRLYPRRAVAPPVVEAAFEAGRRAPGSAGHRAARRPASSPRRPRGSRSRWRS